MMSHCGSSTLLFVVQRFLIQLGILLCIIGGLEKRQIVADCQRENQGDVNHFQWEEDSQEISEHSR